jgi:hypothetical protein
VSGLAGNGSHYCYKFSESFHDMVALLAMWLLCCTLSLLPCMKITTSGGGEGSMAQLAPPTLR